MKCTGLAAIVWLVLLAVAPCLSASKPAGPKYDPATEVKIKGVIAEVIDFECPVSGGMGAHIVLKAGEKNVLVHIALSKFLKDYEMSFAKGEEIEVLGSKVMMDGEEVILAREITRGQNTFMFRDNKGKPLW
jgi:hypothetical protein